MSDDPDTSVPATVPQASATASDTALSAPPSDTSKPVRTRSGALQSLMPSQQPGNVPPELYLHMINLMQNISEQLLKQPERVNITDIFLPLFDPDGNIGVREWCDHITTAMKTYRLSDYDIRMKVTSLLKGRAKPWADTWLITTATWVELRQNIIMTFEPEIRYSQDVLKFRDHVYDSSKDIAEFLSQSWVLWKRLTKDKLDNSYATEAVIGTVSDERLRILLMNARAISVPELISVASSIRVKRPPQSNLSQPPPKRSKLCFDNRNISYCSFCRKPGRVLCDCTLTGPKVRVPEKPLATSSTSKSNVNSVSKNKSKLNTMRIRVGKIILDTIFDSGAECSVMRESVANKLPGSRQQITNYLRGIGPFPVVSTSKLTTVCAIDDINVEIEFNILPDYEMTSDVLIGADLLRETGLSVVVTQNKAILCSQTRVMHVRSSSDLFDNLNHDLTCELEIDQLLALLNNYSDVFTRGFPKSRVKTGQLEIRLKNPDKCVERRPYRLSPVEREKVREIVGSLIDNNIVRESKSPFASPVILVKKKNGEDRMCVDYRELNANTVRDNYPLPLIADQIDQLAGGQFYCILDMASGFHQIIIAPDSVEKTAFVTPDGLYEYVTMPFGLCNAPSVYQRCINRALGPLLSPGSADKINNDSVAQVYIDDVISKCRDFSSGLKYLERILMALRESGFSVNIDKCSFFKRSIEYLGNVVENGQVRPSPKKIEALLKAPVPMNVKQVRQFNGLAGYFRRFIPDFARTMVPLYELTKQGTVWQWTHVHEEARQKIIRHLTSTPVLTIFQEGKPIELFTDASSLGFGAILVQIINGRQHVVAYFSMRTTDIESRYHSYELETLAVVRAIKHFRHFLYGRQFKVITDCNALKASKHKKDLLPRIHRWWAYLQNFEFEIEYRKGERMQHADFFSRNHDSLSVNVLTNNLEWINVEQRRDDNLRLIIDALYNGEDVAGYQLDGTILKHERQDAILGTQKLIVVPKSFQWTLINTFHTALKHPGWEKTLHKIRDTYYFDRMSSIVRDFVDNCIVCRSSKQTSGATQVQMHPIIKPTVPFEVIHMDITGKLGTSNNQEYVVVTVDAYTKYVLLRHTNDKSHHSTLAALKHVIHLFGAPKQIIVDGGREFLGEYKNYCDRFGIEVHTIASGVSRANGQVERVMATLKNGLIMIKNYETPDWHTALESLQLALNCTVHKTTGTAPLTLLTRRQNCVPAELLNLVNLDDTSIDMEALERHVQRKMMEASAKDKERFDRSRAKICHFQRGDFVLVKNNPRNQTSLDPKFSTPYEVHRVLENDRYLVKRVVGHHGRPRKVAHDQLRRAPRPGGTQAAVSPAEEPQAGPSGVTTDAALPSPTSPCTVAEDVSTVPSLAE